MRRLFYLALLFALPAAPQQPAPTPAWQTAAGGHQKFEVATVRPAAPNIPWQFDQPMYGLSDTPDDKPFTTNLFRGTGPIQVYLLFAYKITDSAQAQALYSSLPSWKLQFYHVEARASGTPTRDQMRLMVQSLLAERFKLAAHREIRTGDIYKLALDHPGTLGPDIHPYNAASPCIPNPTPGRIYHLAPTPDAPRFCGITIFSTPTEEFLQMNNITLPQLATYLSGDVARRAGDGYTPRSGMDDTGLTGTYSLTLHYVTEEHPNADGPRLAEALRKQLGLKLVPAKGPIELLILDHIEKPQTD